MFQIVRAQYSIAPCRSDNANDVRYRKGKSHWIEVWADGLNDYGNDEKKKTL